MKNKPFYLSDEHDRSFGGKTEGFENRDEAMKEKKHLKAYLAGKKIYRHGYSAANLDPDSPSEVTSEWTIRQPNYHPVQEIWTKKTPNKNAK